MFDEGGINLAGGGKIEIPRGGALPIGPVTVGIGFKDDLTGTAIAQYGLFQGHGSYNPLTDVWSLSLGFGKTFGNFSTLGGKKGYFLGIGLDQNGVYFELKGASGFPAGNSGNPITYSGVTGNMRFDLFTWHESAELFREIGGVTNTLIADAADLFGRAFTSPIVIDLNNNGFELVHAKDGVHFDIDADGFAEKTGWVKPADAFLTRDLNGNGVIDSQREMFGNDATSTAAQKLAALDTNGDGFVDSKDAGWGSLRLWKDANSDGVSQADEFHTLTSQGVGKLGVGKLGVEAVAA